MKALLLMALTILTLALTENVKAQEIEGDRQPASGVTNYATGSTKKLYPGGRDDSDLTVQPVRRVTRKETDLEHTDEVDEGDLNAGDANGFGE